jgi:hypothetical protein
MIADATPMAADEYEKWKLANGNIVIVATGSLQHS